MEKPCKTCPFRPDAPLGVWHPAAYLGIAYLGSIPEVVGVQSLRGMACHQGLRLREKDPEAELPPCRGWMRAAPDSAALRIRRGLGYLPDEAADDYPVLSPEEMAQRNGLHRLPPLVWAEGDPVYPTLWAWQAAVQGIWDLLAEKENYAYAWVAPGSPLATPRSDAENRRLIGDLPVVENSDE